MYKQICALFLIVILAFTFSTISFAQDKQTKEEKMQLTKSEKEMGPVKSISCGDACGFMVKSRNEKELISIAKKHVKEMHHKKLTDNEVKEKIKTE
jgi:predicted small metal-binding protein